MHCASPRVFAGEVKMATFVDLNLQVSADRNKVRSLVLTAAQLGYSTVALNYIHEPSANQKQEVPVPLDVGELIGQLPAVLGRSRPIRVLNRLTVVMSEAGHFRPIEYKHYDVVAVETNNEKLFHGACLVYDVDIVCVPVNEKLPFFFKRAAINAAIDRGVFLELTYAASLRDTTRRRYTLANANCLADSCKGKNVIISSAATQALELRGPNDISNLGLLFGLSDEDSKLSVSSNCRKVILHGETRKTASGIVSTVHAPPPPDEGPPPPAEAPPTKKPRRS